MEIKYLDEIEDHIKKEFLIEKYIGKGSYGIVWRVKDLKTQKKYALKKIFRAFRNCTDAKRTVREVSFLSQLSNHDNIIKLEKVIKSQNQTDLYLVFEYVESDLHKVIQQKILLPIHQKYIIYQILLVLQYLHSGELIHRDLKPANLLLKKSCIIKLADFGLARCVQDLDETIPVYTEYAATRSYQAPEILFGSQNYSYAVDMWSVGCILFEMLTGQVMYNKEAIYDQIQSIFEFLGTPDDQDIESFKLKNPENLRFQTQLFQTKQTFRMHQILDAYDPKAKDFIKNCMKYNPQQRMTAQQALEHPYVQEFKGHFKQKLSDFKFISLKNDEQLYSVKEYQDILDKFIQFRDGDIQEFKRQNNQKLLTQSNNRTIIQSPIKTFSKNDKITQEHLQTQQNKFGPRIQPENKQFEKNITLQEFQSCDAIDSLCENKKQQFHQPRVSNDTKKMSLKYQLNQRKNSQEFFEWARRLSLQTNCSQFSISENQGSLIKQSAKHYSIYFNHQILSKQFSHIWNIDQIRNFCDHYKLEWAKEILRIHYQIIKLKIWSFILNIYEANRLQLKRLQGLHRSKICTRGKCCRCSGPEGKCTCELLWELLQQITCYIKHIFMAEKLLNIQEIMISTLNEIQSNYYLLIYQYLPKEQVIVLLKIIKLDCLDQLFKQNLIDGFVISVFRKCPFTETNQLLKLFDFNLQYNKNLKMLDFKLIPKLLNFKNIHLVKMSNTLKSNYLQLLEIDQFQTEGQQISHFDDYDLFYFNVKCPKVWKKSLDKKAQTSDDLETFKVFNLEDGRHESIAIDAFRSNSVGMQNHVKKNMDQLKIQKQNSGIERSLRQRQDLIYWNQNKNLKTFQLVLINVLQMKQLLQKRLLQLILLKIQLINSKLCKNQFIQHKNINCKRVYICKYPNNNKCQNLCNFHNKIISLSKNLCIFLRQKISYNKCKNLQCFLKKTIYKCKNLYILYLPNNKCKNQFIFLNNISKSKSCKDLFIFLIKCKVQWFLLNIKTNKCKNQQCYRIQKITILVNQKWQDNQQ